jgi:hypothetical protein
MSETEDRPLPAGLLSDLLGGCGLDGFAAFTATEALIDQLAHRSREGETPCS